MQCPACNVTLVMTERQGVEIDYCPQCRGVWLDRGELDKIVERAGRRPLPAQPSPRGAYQQEYRDDERYNERGKYHKKSLLKDLFDF